MIIIVNDASILIDLMKIDLSDDFFRLPFEMHTTDLVSTEITDENAERFQRYIKKEMINIHSFPDEEWEGVVEIKAENPPLSLADSSCFLLCKQLSATLLTSDGKLKSIASEKGIPVHGIFWIYDQLIFQELITVREAENKLKALIEINPWLPRDECLKRFKKWKSL